MSAPTVDQVVITEPGVYDIPAEVYFADPVPGGSLSNSGARMLLPPSCPAKFKYERDHGRPPKRHFELGHAAHTLVLGVGAQPVLVDAKTWNTKAIKAEVAAIRAAGNVPLKPAEYEQVHGMAAALRMHPIASTLLAPGSGQPEQSLFWADSATGVMRRARLDWLPWSRDGRMFLPDYKSADSAEPIGFSRPLHSYGYYMQGATYTDAVRALGLADDVVFLLIVQEKAPPYVVTVIEPDPVAIQIGRERNRVALEIYRQCVAEDRWPGYSDDVERVPLPLWVEREHRGETW